MIYLPAGGLSKVLSLPGDILGMFENVNMEILEMKVAVGDRFYIYTAGIIESDGRTDISREEGLGNLIKQIDSTGEFSVEKSVEIIINGLFGDTSELADDILLLGFEV